MNNKILIIEDELRVVHLVMEVLSAAGYSVISAGNGKQALELMAIEQPNLVLLDIMLPDNLDGYQVCQRLREFSSVPIIMLTAKAQDTDKLRGFDAGADDYLTKPFNAKELIARVKAVLRRAQLPEEIVTRPLVCGELEINFAQHAVTIRGTPIELTRTEFALLRELVLNANRVMTHQDLLTQVWGPEYRDDIDYLRAYIRYLRKKLEADPANPKYILTCAGVGYQFACPEKTDQL